jgi:hydroxymethylpyrimidine pyrophosphatase-like HAD family hydrolase
MTKIFCFDIDGVIMSLTPDNNYALATPMTTNVELINYLYEKGHRIIVFTARGSATGIDWSDVTKKQLSNIGLNYHELIFGKPAADYYIDDKMIDLNDLTLQIKSKNFD